MHFVTLFTANGDKQTVLVDDANFKLLNEQFDANSLIHFTSVALGTPRRLRVHKYSALQVKRLQSEVVEGSEQ